MADTISFTSQGKAVAAELYSPPAATKTGVVVVAYGSDGLTEPWAPMIRDYAESLAKSGFVALIPEYLSITGPQRGIAVFDLIALHRDSWQAALSSAIDHAKTLPRVSATRVGLLGFSLGGHLCLRLRAKANVLVEYFAPVFDGIGPPGKLTHAQIHHGEADALPATSFPNAKAIEKTLKQEGTSTELFAYPGAGHGFVGSDRANTEARKLSKPQTLSFFQSHL